MISLTYSIMPLTANESIPPRLARSRWFPRAEFIIRGAEGRDNWRVKPRTCSVDLYRSDQGGALISRTTKFFFSRSVDVQHYVSPEIFTVTHMDCIFFV
jgi:hypothetical protein